MEGWIKLHRKLLDWEWYSDTNAKVLFLHCLLKANIKDTNWKGMEIKRGQFFTSNASLSNELGLSIKEIRNSLKKLEKTGELTFFGASNGTMITVCNYDNYQHLEQSTGKRWASDGQAMGKQRATDREEEEREEEKKEKELYSFDRFWDLYGKKQDKDKCSKKWDKLKEEEKHKAMNVIQNYVLSTPDVKFRKNPLTWLNGKCWEDEMTIYQQPSQPTSQPKNPKIVTQTGYDGFKFD